MLSHESLPNVTHQLEFWQADMTIGVENRVIGSGKAKECPILSPEDLGDGESEQVIELSVKVIAKIKTDYASDGGASPIGFMIVKLKFVDSMFIF